MRAPPESFRPITGAPIFIARSITLQIFSANASRERAAEDGEVLREDEDLPPVDRPVAGDDAVAEGLRVVHPEVRLAVRDEAVELDERARVEERVDAARARSACPAARCRSTALSVPAWGASSRSSWSRSSFSCVDCRAGACLHRATAQRRGAEQHRAMAPSTARRSGRTRTVSRGSSTHRRYDHPTGPQAERALGELEGGQALLYASGTAASPRRCSRSSARAKRWRWPRRLLRDSGAPAGVRALGGSSSNWTRQAPLPDRRRPDLARGALEPVADLPGHGGRGREPRAGARRPTARRRCSSAARAGRGRRRSTARRSTSRPPRRPARRAASPTTIRGAREGLRIAPGPSRRPMPHG